MRSPILKPLFSLLSSLLAVSLAVCIASTPCSAAKPLPVAEGEYRLGDSPQTPEDGLAWLTVDTDGPDWKPFLAIHGHPARAFTNVWRRYRLPKTALKDPTLYLNGWPSFEAYVDNEMVYKAGVLYPHMRNKFVSHAWHLIPLPPNFANKYIYFRAFSERPEVFSERAWISVASRSDNLIDMVRRELAQATRPLSDPHRLWCDLHLLSQARSGSPLNGLLFDQRRALLDHAHRRRLDVARPRLRQLVSHAHPAICVPDRPVDVPGQHHRRGLSDFHKVVADPGAIQPRRTRSGCARLLPDAYDNTLHDPSLGKHCDCSLCHIPPPAPKETGSGDRPGRGFWGWESVF